MTKTTTQQIRAKLNREVKPTRRIVRRNEIKNFDIQQLQKHLERKELDIVEFGDDYMVFLAKKDEYIDAMSSYSNTL